MRKSILVPTVLATRQYHQRVKTLNPIAYWPLWDSSGLAAIDLMGLGNGAYTSVTLGQPGIGDGRTSATFSAGVSWCDIYSAALNTAFKGSVGSIASWAKVANAGEWTGGVARVVARFQVDANNFVSIEKSALANSLFARYKAGGTEKSIVHGSFSPTTFFHFAMTWNKADDAMKVYVNGIKSGSTQTGLGVWSGALDNVKTVIGAGQTAPGSNWVGSLAHISPLDYELTPAQIASLAVV